MRGWSPIAIGIFGVAAAACARVADEPAGVQRSELTAAPFVGPESRIDQPVYLDRLLDQVSPFTAAGGPGALVTWIEKDNYEGDALWFTRLDKDGAMLDRVGKRLTLTVKGMGQGQRFQEAAWNGDRALVAWVEAVKDNSQIRGARIASDGTVLDRDGFDIAVAGDFRRDTPQVLPDGSGFVVVWFEPRGIVKVARVSRDGAVTPPGGVTLTLPGGTQSVASLLDAAAVDGGFLLLLSNGNDPPQVMKVDGAGKVLAPLVSTTAEPLFGCCAALASNGATALAVWWRSTIPSEGTVQGARISAAGAWLDAAPFAVTSVAERQGNMGVTWNGTSFVIHWENNTGNTKLKMRRWGADGVAVDAAPIVPASLASTPVYGGSVVWTGTKHIATLERSILTMNLLPYRPMGVMARALGPDLLPLGADATALSIGANTQTRARVAGSPGAAYVVWDDDRRVEERDTWGTANFDVYGARLTISGGKLEHSVSPLFTSAERELAPGVGWDGTAFAVTCNSDTRPNQGSPKQLFASLPPSGAPLGKPILLRPGNLEDAPTLLWNGTSYLLFRPDRGVGNFERISSAGAPLDKGTTFLPLADPFAVGHVNFVTWAPRGIALGGAWLFVWQGIYYNGYNNAGVLKPPETDIHGAVVGADGTLTTPKHLSIAVSPGDQVTPAIATDGQSALVLWVDRGASGGDGGVTNVSRLVAARHDSALARLDATDVVIAEAQAPELLGTPLAAWTGTEYVVVWTRASGGVLTFHGCALGADLHCQPGTGTSTPTGIAASTALPSEETRVSRTTGDLGDPSLVWTDAGGILTYLRYDADPNVERIRLYGRPVIIGTAPPPGFDAGTDAVVADAAAGSADGGGAGGRAGTTGTAGQAGTGGAQTGAGGSAAGAAGAGSGGASGAGGAAKTGGGCGCRLASEPTLESATGALTALAVASLLSRRRRHRQATSAG